MLLATPFQGTLRVSKARSQLAHQGPFVAVALPATAIGLRRAKGMVLDPDDHDTWSVGSFFTNPVLDEAAAAELQRRVAAQHRLARLAEDHANARMVAERRYSDVASLGHVPPGGGILTVWRLASRDLAPHDSFLTA